MQEQGTRSYCPLNNSRTAREGFLEETGASLCSTPSMVHLEQLHSPSTSWELPQHFQWPSFYSCMQGSWELCSSSGGMLCVGETRETQTQVPDPSERPGKFKLVFWSF